MSATKTKFGSLLLLLQGILLILFIVFVDYGDEFKNDDSKEFEGNISGFQDLHIVAFLGFGLIGTFLRRYTRGMFVHAFLIGGLVIQWATLVQGFFKIQSSKVELTLDQMVSADYAVVVVLISFGAVVGKANSLQLLIIALIETFFFSINEVICKSVLKITDPGQSIIVHLFGAAFGLAVARMIYSKKICLSHALSTSNKSEMYALLGTVFLWIYWPGLNASTASGAAKRRAIANTYYALAASCISTFAFTVLTNKEGRFNMLHLQNATIAGGIGIGAVSTLMVRPWGSVIVGIVGAFSSVMGYKYILPKFRRSLKIHDVRGINAAHGMPALVSGVASVVAAFVATESSYGSSLYDIYPARTPAFNTTKFNDLLEINSKFQPGDNRSGYMQGLFQFVAIIVTVTISLLSGLLTGFIIRMQFFEPLSVHDAFDDLTDFQEANCIDICSDDEYEDDHERHHDSIHGRQRLLDTDRHSDIVASNNTPYTVAQHYGELSPDSIRKSHTSFDQKSTHSSIPALNHTPNHSKSALNHAPDQNTENLDISKKIDMSEQPVHANNQPDDINDQPATDGNNIELVQKPSESNALIDNAHNEETTT